MPFGSITLTAGPSQCGFDSLALMTMGWPLGTVPKNDMFARQYIRDPGNRFSDQTMVAFEENAALPPDAFDTGYRYGSDELWVSIESVDQMVFVRRGDRVERWPRARELFACA